MPQASNIPAPQDISSTDRKEAAIDTEVVAGIGGVPNSSFVSLYANYKQFNNTGSGTNIETKQPDRDTNLGGPGAGLPNGMLLKWFEMRLQLCTYYANLNLASNQGVSEQINRIRENMAIEVKFSRTALFICPASDLVSFLDSRYITSSFGGYNSAPNVSQRGGRSVTTDDKPFIIMGNEWAEVNFRDPNSAFSGPQNANTGITLIVPVYVRSFLDGILSLASL